VINHYGDEVLKVYESPSETVSSFGSGGI
jgi:hypothetical protein